VYEFSCIEPSVRGSTLKHLEERGWLRRVRYSMHLLFKVVNTHTVGPIIASNHASET
jgi:hypothetical protein